MKIGYMLALNQNTVKENYLLSLEMLRNLSFLKVGKLKFYQNADI